MRGITSVLVLALVGIICGGCSSGGNSGTQMAEGKQAVEGFKKTQEALVNAQKQVDETTAAMNALSGAGDLPAANKKFNSEVSDLRKSAEGAKKRGEAMRAKQEAFVDKWRKEMSTIKDPALQSTLESRRAAVRANFEKVRNAGEAVRDAYAPFMAQIEEVQKTLAINLSQPTVAGIKPTLDRANASAATLKQKIAALQTELNNIQSGLSAAAK